MTLDATTLAERICTDVAELGDRNSPADWPEAMLVTRAELHTIVIAALSEEQRPAAWNDGKTAALVNALRDTAVEYHATQQLRERIAHLVRPIAQQIAQALTRPAYLSEADQHALHRFIETSEDDESYDIGKPAIKRLAELGAVCNEGFGRYSVTAFGYWAHEHYWHQSPPLPLTTNADRDAEHRASIANRA